MSKIRIRLGDNECVVSRYNQSFSFTIRDEKPAEVKARALELYGDVLHAKCRSMLLALKAYQRERHAELRKAATALHDELPEWQHTHRMSYGLYTLSCVPWKNAKYGEFIFVHPVVAQHIRVLTTTSESVRVVE